MTTEYNAPAADDPNALIIAPKSKRTRKVDQAPERKSSKNRHKAAVKAVEAKLSKKRRRLLEAKKEAKIKKAERNNVLEELQKYQSVITDALDQQSKEKSRVGYCEEKRRKLRSVGPKKQSNERDDVWQSGVHYDTDSESENEEEHDIKDEPKVVVKSEEEEVMQIEEDETPRTSSAATKQLYDSDSDVDESAHLPQQRRVRQIIYRSDEVQKARSMLPVCAEEQAIVEAVNESDIVILCGETGSGKSTQVPQMLYEAGYTSVFVNESDEEPTERRICITQPRRVAAVQMAARVGEEMGQAADSRLVAHHVRYDATVDADTRVVFMTDGVLLRQMNENLHLPDYSVIVIDEAHERSFNSDILIGLLSRVVAMRRRRGDPLKLLIMSATLRVSDFTESGMFATKPRVLNIPSRQFSVTTHFERRTEADYVQQAYEKICSIHEKNNIDGTILTFVTGQKEVHQLLRMLRERYKGATFDVREEPSTKKRRKKKPKSLAAASKVSLTDYATHEKRAPIYDSVDPDELEEELCFDFDDIPSSSEPAQAAGPILALPLYSLMPLNEQRRVFETPPPGTRLVVVATNVAETSLTIPNVRYVVDTGRCKRRVRDPVTGMTRFIVTWTSKASAEQRRGRAGRTAPGECYRTYTRAVFTDEMPEHTPPDILERPVDELVLHMHSMGIVHVRRFPFITPPPSDAVDAAMEHLRLLGAIEPRPGENESSKNAVCRVTSLGRTIALLPVAPHWGKLLVLASQRSDVLAYAVILVSLFSTREPLMPLIVPNDCPSKGKDCPCKTCKYREQAVQYILNRKRVGKRSTEWRCLGDLGVLLALYLQAEDADLSLKACERIGVRQIAMQEVRQQRRQLTSVLNRQCALKEELLLVKRPKDPSDAVLRALRQCVVAAMPKNLAMRAALTPAGDEEQTNSVATSAEGPAYRTLALNDPVRVSPMSVLFAGRGSSTTPIADMLLYQQLLNQNGKKYMDAVCVVDDEWPPMLMPQNCDFSELSKVDVSDAKAARGVHYDADSDRMVAARRCVIGGKWPLRESVLRPVEDITAYVHFLAALMKGEVIESLQKYASKWMYRPTLVARSLLSTTQVAGGQLVLKNDSSPLARAVRALIAHHILSRAALFARLRIDGEYMLPELSELLPANERDMFVLQWPPKDADK